MLKNIEKLRLKPYDDQTGKEITKWCKGATIGYGHLIQQSEWSKYATGIDELGASTLFLADLAPFVQTVNSKVAVALSQNQFDALVMLAFNIGAGNEGLSSSSVLKLVNDPTAKTNHPNLEAAWKAWNKSQGVINNGLNNRRAAEWKIYSQNLYQRW